MAEKSKNTQEEIIEAARGEFLTHGFEGTRLHVVSEATGVTKAMIHYYFNTKKELFEHVYRESIQTIYGDLNELLSQELPLFKKIESLIENSLEKSVNHPRELAFVVTESTRKAEWLQPIFEEQINLEVGPFKNELEKAASNYQVASVSVTDLLLNIFSLCYFPVMAKSIHQSLLSETSDSANDFDPQKRKGIILDTILNWLTA